MPDYHQMFYDIEVHSVEGIRRYFGEGGDPNEVHYGIPLFTTMAEMYLRSPRFSQCVSVFIGHGLQFDDPALKAKMTYYTISARYSASRIAVGANKDKPEGSR